MKEYKFYLDNHNAYCITPIEDDVIRVRYNASGIFKQSLMERYDIITTDFAEPAHSMIEDGGKRVFTCGEMVLEIEADGALSVIYKGEKVIERLSPIQPQEDLGIGGRILVPADERFYGGGFRQAKNIELRGTIIKNWCAPVTCNGPCPFIMGSRGWGLFWNNTHETWFDFAYKKEDEVVFWAERGEFDIFLFAGSFKKMIMEFTDVTGKPSLMPLNGYGITAVNGEAENEVSLIDKAERVRREHIPCDNFSISCEWMDTYYDKSVKQKFNTDRYFVHDWMSGANTFVSALTRFGIKTTLWTPCDYDLTFEQERIYQRKHPEEAAKEEGLYTHPVKRTSRNPDAGLAFKDERLTPIKRYHPFTVPDEAWNEHFKRFWDLGIVGVAEDAHRGTLTRPDLFFGNGRSIFEMHNLNQTLNSLQYFESYKEYRKRRIFVRTPSTFIGHQKYCATWCGDTTSDLSLLGLVQYSFQGQSNVTADLFCRSAEQIHSGMLMPWVLTFYWGQPHWPWMLPDNLREIYEEYARLRYALMPYFYTAAYNAHKTGISICTAMVLSYPNDERFYDDYNQYMIGDSLLVGALSRTINLPEGNWIDYWTGKRYEGAQTVSTGYPKGKGGYFFVKSGAIIPMWEGVEYVGHKPIDTLTVDIYPEGKGSYTLYEDDGITFECENGKFALTEFSYEENDAELAVTVAPSAGEYRGKPAERTYHLSIHMAKPATLPEGATYDEEKNVLWVNVENAGTVVIKK